MTILLIEMRRSTRPYTLFLNGFAVVTVLTVNAAYTIYIDAIMIQIL